VRVGTVVTRSISAAIGIERTFLERGPAWLRYAVSLGVRYVYTSLSAVLGVGARDFIAGITM